MNIATPQNKRASQQPRHIAPRVQQLDGSTLLGIVLLLAVGLIALFSASYPSAINKFDNGMYFITRQGLYAILGFVGMIVVSGVDYHVYLRFQKPLFLACMGLLILVPFIGVEHNGAQRWIELPILGEFQPSELMKLSVIISFSYYAVKMGDKVREIQGDLPFFGALVAIAGLLYLEPHLSATIIIFGIGLAILIVAGMKIWYFIPLGVVAGAAGTWYITTQGYANARIQSWLDPFATAEIFRHDGWQGGNSQIAIGSGGFWGRGLGQGLQKHLYLPEPQNDFIFSAWCEEMGFIGAMIVIILFAFLIYRCYYVAFHAPDKMGCLIATGIATKLAIQTLVNLWVVTGLFPVTGASLPFFSYGGTALIMQMGEMGILLNISRNMRPSEKRRG